MEMMNDQAIRPPWPEGAPRTTRPIPQRYEDISQDGRLLLEAAPQALGEAIWRAQLATAPMARALRKAGIVPILTRLVVEGTDGPFSVAADLEGTGSYQVAASVGGDGAIERLYVLMWADIDGRIGRTYGPQPPGAGERRLAARVFAEHVLTRLFAPPAERRVTSLDGLGPDIAAVPPARYQSPRAEALLEPPPGATPLDDALVLDPVPFAVGLVHTDSNQHVNSLVYPRLFEEAALRRLAAHGRSTALLGRAVDIHYRKPFFAGQKIRTALRLWATADGGVCAAGVFLADSGDGSDPLAGRPHATCRLWLR
jgi:hypothetical protein